MSIKRSGAFGSAVSRKAVEVDPGEIFPTASPASADAMSQSMVRANEVGINRQRYSGGASSAIEPLNVMLGAALTAGNPAWCGYPVPRMRALQKKLLERGMQSTGVARDTALAGITVVEKNIRLRLRLEQLVMQDDERQNNGEPTAAGSAP